MQQRQQPQLTCGTRRTRPMPEPGKVVKSVGRTVGRTAGTVGKTAGRTAGTVGKTAGKVVGTVGDAASAAVKAVGDALPIGTTKTGPPRRSKTQAKSTTKSA